MQTRSFPSPLSPPWIAKIWKFCKFSKNCVFFEKNQNFENLFFLKKSKSFVQTFGKALTHTPPRGGGVSPESSVGTTFWGGFGRRKAKKAPPQAGFFFNFWASEVFDTLEKTCFRRPKLVRNLVVPVRNHQNFPPAAGLWQSALYQLMAEYSHYVNSWI